MKVTIKVEKEFDLKVLRVKANVRYWDDSTLNGENDTEGEMPCALNDLWCPEIQIETGIVLNWKQGSTAEIHYKVADECGWELVDKDFNIVLSAEDGYVPNTLCPQDNGYGDYIIMNIDENGKIENWNFNINDFTDEEED